MSSKYHLMFEETGVTIAFNLKPTINFPSS